MSIPSRPTLDFPLEGNVAVRFRVLERGAEIGRAWLEHEAFITNFEMAYLIVLLGIEHIGNIGRQVLA